MSALNDGGPVFPTTQNVVHPSRGIVVGQIITGGMSLRDYFAAAALQGMLATGRTWTTNLESDVPLTCQANYAAASYLIADGMLAERARKEAQP